MHISDCLTPGLMKAVDLDNHRVAVVNNTKMETQPPALMTLTQFTHT